MAKASTCSRSNELGEACQRPPLPSGECLSHRVGITRLEPIVVDGDEWGRGGGRRESRLSA